MQGCIGLKGQLGLPRADALAFLDVRAAVVPRPMGAGLPSAGGQQRHHHQQQQQGQPGQRLPKIVEQHRPPADTAQPAQRAGPQHRPGEPGGRRALPASAEL